MWGLLDIITKTFLVLFSENERIRKNSLMFMVKCKYQLCALLVPEDLDASWLFPHQ